MVVGSLPLPMWRQAPTANRHSDNHADVTSFGSISLLRSARDTRQSGSTTASGMPRCASAHISSTVGGLGHHSLTWTPHGARHLNGHMYGQIFRNATSPHEEAWITRLPQIHYERTRMIVLPLIRFVGLKAATASSRIAMLPMFVRSCPSRTR